MNEGSSTARRRSCAWYASGGAAKYSLTSSRVERTARLIHSDPSLRLHLPPNAAHNSHTRMFKHPSFSSRRDEINQGIVVQFSITNFGTRANSRVLFVTSVNPRPRAWAAMNKSLAPIIVPGVSKAARI